MMISLLPGHGFLPRPSTPRPGTATTAATHRSRAGGRRRLAHLLLVLCLLCLQTSVQAKTRTVALTTSAYAPLVEPRQPPHGLLGEIVTRVLREMELEPVYQFQPWKRGQAEVRAGRTWATFPYVRTPERERLYRFSRHSLIDNRILFFHLRARFPAGIEWQTLEDLRPWVIGGVRGYWYEDTLNAANLTVDYTTSVEAALRKLEKGRIDLFPVTELVGWGMIEQLFPGQAERFAVLERPYQVVPSYLMVSRSYPDSEALLQRFDEAFEALSASGELQRIRERYLRRP